MISVPARLREVPLNAEVAFLPFSTTDSIALTYERFTAERVLTSRNSARVARRYHAFPGDLVKSDWEFGLGSLAHEQPHTRLSISSFIAVDQVLQDGSVEFGRRPTIGNRTRRSEPRLPRLLVLRTRNSSQAALEELGRSNLLLVDLAKARGAKTSTMVEEGLNGAKTDVPSILLAQNASDLVRYGETRLFGSIILAISTEAAPARITSQVLPVARDRPQHERQFRYSLPSEHLTGEETELVALARSVWRYQWRRLGGDEAAGPIQLRFREAVNSLRRRSRTSADRFAMTNGLLETSTDITRAGRNERRAALLAAVASLAKQSARVAVVVGAPSDVTALTGAIDSVLLSGLAIAPLKHFAGAAETADAVVVGGYYGPGTLDAIMRLRPRTLTWVIDPVEASAANFDAKLQVRLLERLGLADSAATVRQLVEALQTAGGIILNDDVQETALFRDFTAAAQSTNRPSDASLPENGDEITLCFADGSALVASTNLRFDVVRPGAPHPTVVAAGDLEEGDQVLIVRGDHQHTLSELLIEDMDAAELHNEASSRAAWVAVCRSAAKRLQLRPGEIAAQLRTAGSKATSVAVRSWLREDGEVRTPSDWVTFQAFATALQLDLPLVVVRQFYESIRRWRIAHRKRGRDVVRLLRAAWFGGLSPVEASRVEERWGLGVRDLIEGSRVLEIERVLPLGMENLNDD